MAVPYEQGLSDAIKMLAREFASKVIGAIEGTPSMSSETLIGIDDSEVGLAVFYVPLCLKEPITKLINKWCGESIETEETIQEYGDQS